MAGLALGHMLRAAKKLNPPLLVIRAILTAVPYNILFVVLY